jgi:hypothetical protein
LHEAAKVSRALLLLLSLFVAQSLQAGLWGSRGETHDLELRGDQLFVADGRGVTVYDVSDPAAIRRLHVVIGDAESHDAALSGDDLLVLATDAGIEWFAVDAAGTLFRQGSDDIGGPLTVVAASATSVAGGGGKSVTVFERTANGLRRRGGFRGGSPVHQLLFVGEYLYAAFEGGGIVIYDPRSRMEVGLIAGQSPSMALDGDLLWVGGGQTGFGAYDVSDPSDPRRVITRVGDRQRHALEVAADEGLLYVRESEDLVRVYDVSEPTAPREVSTLEDWVHVMLSDGRRLLHSGTIFDEEDLPFGTGVPVRIHDFSAAESPRLLGEVRDLAGPVSGVFTDGSIAYVVDPPFFRTIDVSRTDMPREMASIEVPNIQDSVRVRNGLAIVYGRADVNLIDVSDPWNLRLLGTWDAQGHPRSSAALLRDTFVEANEHSGLHIVDYSDPANGVQIAGRIFHYHDVAAGDDVVYTLMAEEFVTLDLRDRNRVVVSQELSPDTYLKVDTVPPNTAYPTHLVVSENEGLGIWSLADRFAPRMVAMIELSKIEVFGTSASSAYIAHDGQLVRVDIPSRSGPFETGMRVTAPMQISAAGVGGSEKVVVADRYGLRVYGPDTEPPPPPPPPPAVVPGKRRSVRGF